MCSWERTNHLSGVLKPSPERDGVTGNLHVQSQEPKVEFPGTDRIAPGSATMVHVCHRLVLRRRLLLHLVLRHLDLWRHHISH